MSEQLLDLLKLGLLVLLYLFFLRVLWAVGTQLRTPALVEVEGRRERRQAKAQRRAGRGPRAGGAPRGREATMLVGIAPEPWIGQQVLLADQVTFGRAPSCTIVVDDTYVSQTHARIVRGTDGWYFEDLASTNGSRHNQAPVDRPVRLDLGDRIAMGNVVLEVR